MFVIVTSTLITIVLLLLLVPRFINLTCYPSKRVRAEVDTLAKGLALDVIMMVSTSDENALLLYTRRKIRLIAKDLDHNGRCKLNIKRLATKVFLYEIQRRCQYLTNTELKNKVSYVVTNVKTLSESDVDEPLTSH